MSNKFRTYSRVSELLFSRSPATVFRGVVAVAINSVQRVVATRARPHVSVKVFKTCPALANLDAPRSIPLVGRMFSQAATTEHAVPDLIFCCRLAASADRNRHSVSPPLSLRLLKGTAAARGISATEVGHRNNDCIAAIAFAKHASNFCISVLTNFRRGLRKCCEFTEPNSQAIYGCSH